MSNCSTPASPHQVSFALQTKSPRQVEGPQALLSTDHRAADAQHPHDTALKCDNFISLLVVQPKGVTAHS